MRRLIAGLALTLALVFGQTAFGFEVCTTGCGTGEPCYDGYCEDSYWLGCGDFWAIVQTCQPYYSTASFGASSAAPAAEAGFQPHFKLEPRAANPALPELGPVSCVVP